MVPGSVIVDVSIDQGGNCAPTLAGEVSVYDQVTLVGVHASRLYADNVLHYVSNLFKDGRIRWDDDIVRNTLVTHEGRALPPGPAMGLAVERS
jgi:NAD(P) transhydrogenase subunit alpha